MPPKLQIRKRRSGLVKEIGRITISVYKNANDAFMEVDKGSTGIGDNTAAGGVTGYIKAILAD